MRQELAHRASVSAGTDTPDSLRRFLQAYWLRPENALWMTLRSDTLRSITFEHPSIDVSCGDGVFSFLHFGGVFDPEFDVFGAVTGLDRVRDEHADMFDCVNDSYRPTVLTPPSDTVDVGSDFKPTLLAKAKRLRLYDRLVEHDNNRSLPFPDHSFRTVYCNAAYWVANVDGFLGELGRVTQPGGRIILQVKLDSMRRYSLAAHRAVLGDRFLEILDRGRTDCWPTIAGRAGWESRFSAAGLSVVAATPFITRTHAYLWDVGLRPLAPMLVKMANALTPQARSTIKREWVSLFSELLEPLCQPDLDLFEGRDEPGEMQYVLQPG